VNGVLIDIVVFAMVAVSLTVLMGFTGQISLGHWALVGVGSFATANLFDRFHVPFLVTVPLVVLIGMVVSLVIGIPALRIKGLYLAIVTLTFSYAAEFYIFKSSTFGGSQSGINMTAPKLGPLDLDDPSNRPLFFFALAMLALSLAVAGNLSRSRTGRSFFALRENEKAAATLGVDLTRAKLTAFAVSGGIAALAGAVYSMQIGNVNAVEFPTQTSLILITVVMIGGIGSLQGAGLGALLVIGLPRLFEFENQWLIPIGTGILLIVVIVRARGGLAGLVQRGREEVVGALVDLSDPQPQPQTGVAVPSRP
jgi:branched-chain amino acid transport system permease protein